MAGGRGLRFKSLGEEKPLVPLAGCPLIAYVASTLRRAETVDDIIIATSPHTPKTKTWGKKESLDVTVTPGLGYVPDFQHVLMARSLREALVVSADLPLLKNQTVDDIVNFSRHVGKSNVTVCIPDEARRRLKLPLASRYTVKNGSRRLLPIGINVVKASGEDRVEVKQVFYLLCNVEEALNINTLEDLKAAEKLLTLRRRLSLRRDEC